MPKYLTAKQAAEALGISVSSLYAYVSRGLIRSETGDESSRQRRYLAEDVEKLKERKEFQQNPAKAVQSSLHWGTPMLDSAITLIDHDTLYYRGLNVAQLALEHTIEEVAALIWTGSMDSASSLFAAPLKTDLQLGGLPPIQKYQALLALASVDDLAAYDLRPESVALAGARILKFLALSSGGRGQTIADILHYGWCRQVPQAARLLNAALILSADHELNVSTFAARVVASSEANPYAVVIAGLSAMQGFRHGGNTERVEGFLREAGTIDGVALVIAERMRRGEKIPGFGHVIYKNGDPRAKVLLSLLDEMFPHAPALALCHAAIQRMGEIGVEANIDLPMAVMAQILGLPRGGALAVFALGRVVGWIGHAMEQYTDDKLIRPRARYTGNPPIT